jgi:hypothetical protein
MIPRMTIHRWFKKNERWNTLQDDARSGCPSKIPKVAKIIMRKILQKNYNLPENEQTC